MTSAAPPPHQVELDLLLPHRPPMRLLEKLVAWSPTRSEALAVARAGAPCFEDGEFVPLWGIELMAQAAAASVAYGAMVAADERACFGMVIGVDGYEVTDAPPPREGDALRVDTALVAEIPPAAELEAEITCRGVAYARGRIRLVIGERRPTPPTSVEPVGATSFMGSELAVTERGADRISARLVVGPAHPYLQGHFPGLPLLPAVGQLRFVEHLLGTALGEDLRVRCVPRARFLEPVGPGQPLELTLQLSGREAGWALRSEAGLVSRGKLGA